MAKSRYLANHSYFKRKSLQSCYWAGFIAADGNVHKKLLTIALADKDLIQLIKFNEHLESNNSIRSNNKGDFLVNRLQITSKEIIEDLFSIYNITERKSLTLKPPIGLSNDQIDSFICGYIDGDGCICSHFNRNVRTLTFSILGTCDFLNFIHNRFKEILNCSFVGKINPKPNTNIFEFRVNSVKARRLFLYYYDLKIYKMSRKWNSSIYNEIITFKKKNVLNFEIKMKRYYDYFFIQNLNFKDVMNIEKVSYKNCHKSYRECIKFFHSSKKVKDIETEQ